MSPVSLLGPKEVRSLAAELRLTPTKRLGQNFVTDPNTVRRIVRLAGVAGGDSVLEVGPGLGSLTLALLEAGARVTAVEIDSRLADKLADTVRQRAPECAERVRVLQADALRLDPAALSPTASESWASTRPASGTSSPAEPSVSTPAGRPTLLVANLPYNVSVPVLLRLLADVPSLVAGVVMVQAEVGERLASPVGSKAYGAPSVKAAWYGTWRIAGTVSRNVFWPEPNVDSVLVAFRRTANPAAAVSGLRERVFSLVDAAFGQRRKMLRRSLESRYGGVDQATRALVSSGLDPAWRGERLSVADFVRLAEAGGPAFEGPTGSGGGRDAAAS